MRRRRKGPDALLSARLDKAWQQRVKAGGICQRCGRSSGVLHAHHVFGRQNRRLRWDVANGLALCFQCHRWWHDFPGLSWPWFEKKYPERSIYLLTAEPAHYTLADKKAMLADLLVPSAESQGMEDAA